MVHTHTQLFHTNFNTQLFHTQLFHTHLFHELEHTNFHTQRCHTHNKLEHTNSHTQLFHTQLFTHTHNSFTLKLSRAHSSFTHSLSHKILLHTHRLPFTHDSFRYNIVTHNLSLSHTALSCAHTHTTLHTQLYHTQFFHTICLPPSPISFPIPFSHLFWVCWKIDMWGYPVLYFFLNGCFFYGCLAIVLVNPNSFVGFLATSLVMSIPASLQRVFGCCHGCFGRIPQKTPQLVPILWLQRIHR